MTGTELATFCEEINGGASINDTLLFQFINLAKAMVEQRRPWMLLRTTDTSKTITAANTWQTAIDLSTITKFSRFYGENPIKLYSGVGSNFTEYHQVPYDKRLSYQLAPNTFVYNEATKTLYLNGTPPYAGTLYIDHIIDSDDITDDDTSTWVFPAWAHSLLGFMAVAIYKGGVDFDDVNARMAPDNRAMAEMLTRNLENWDNEKQLTAQMGTDPYQDQSDFRSGAININT